MTGEEPGSGRVRRTATGSEGQLTRRLDHGRETVWRMLTEEAQIAQWLAPGTIEPHAGGRVRIDFGDSGLVIDSQVTACDPPSRLGFSWSSGTAPLRPLVWDLEAAGGGTLLTLTVTLPGDEDIAKACAGFDAHLEMLAAALEGVPMKFPFEHYLAARRAYQAMLET
ncbi:MAG: SRPBCC domain-containing protein [Rubellimicrobium sp.]|nr:SRPBCC domain-containing protein [Rubellimicrobium sp.]